MSKKRPSGESFYNGYTLFIKEAKTIDLPAEVAGVGFVRKGIIFLSVGDIKTKKVEEGNLVFFPPGMSCFISSPSEASLFVFDIPEVTTLCHHFLPDTIFNDTTCREEFFFPLPINPYIENIMDITEKYIRNGLTDPLLLQIKAYEFFHFIKLCYSEDLIYQFFSPILSEKYRFTHFVLSYYTSVKTVEELAKLSCYSLSGFDKEFRKVFGMAPYKWMLKMKTESIYLDIKETTKPLKLIAKEYHFDTPSGLTDFCRRHLGLAPSAIRNKQKI